MNLGDLNKVWEIKALKKAGQEEARSILERVAKLVQPIMRKHKWRVKLLSEFCPNNRSLLGLNVGGGVHVKLRLRRPNRDCDFFPFDQILDTMLHELCHNVHGPHNANFYKFWDEIRKECEDLMAKGISGSGEGFDLPGRRLGGFSRQPSLSSLRQTSLAAAEKRARMGSLLPSGPKRLGGDSSIMVALSPIQAAAMAAERRFQDDVWCGSELCEESGEGECSSSTDISKEPASTIQNAENAISRKRSHESNSSFVDLTTDNSVSQKRIHRTDNKSLPPLSQSVFVHRESGLTNSSKNASTSESKFTWNLDETGKTEEPVMWECATCTLLNPPLAPICELCSTHKPKDVDKKYKFWSCKFCTLENSVKLEKCTACGKWRYSHGSPVATRAPNLGT